MKPYAAFALLTLLASAAGAQAQAFKDLPGVMPGDAADEYRSKGAPVCRQTIEVPRGGDSDWMPRDIYVCEQNGMSATSRRLPPSSIRVLRGLDY